MIKNFEKQYKILFCSSLLRKTKNFAIIIGKNKGNAKIIKQ